PVRRKQVESGRLPLTGFRLGDFEPDGWRDLGFLSEPVGESRVEQLTGFQGVFAGGDKVAAVIRRIRPPGREPFLGLFVPERGKLGVELVAPAGVCEVSEVDL